MAIAQINTAAYDYAMMLSVINISYATQADITLTNFGTTGVPAIESGSIFVNNGAIFTVSGDAAINDSGVANGWVYVKYSTGNSRFEYVVAAPTWSDAKQGYYSSNDRYFFKMYKVGAGEFRYKVKFKISYEIGRPFETDIYRSYAGETENNIFDDLTYLVPSADDRQLCIGYGDEAGASLGSLNMFYRSDATKIIFSPSAFQIDDAGVVVYTMSLHIILETI